MQNRFRQKDLNYKICQKFLDYFLTNPGQNKRFPNYYFLTILSQTLFEVYQNNPIQIYLASSGIGKIHLIDFDTVDVTNLHRQIFYALEDVGKPKVEVLADFIRKRAPFTEVSFTNKPISKKNVFELISEVDIVVDGTDSLTIKYLLNDACVIKKKPLVYGSLYKFDGYVATFNVLQKDGSYSSNLRDAFPEMATDIPNCEEAGTLNSIVGTIATQQVNEILKLITGIGKQYKRTLN